MRAYLELMHEALENGAIKADRTGTGVRSLFGRQIRFDLARLSARHDQAAASQVDRSRADLVSQRRHQHRLSQGERRFDLG